jgi:tetratricopeptide (TPR) repeat protein
MSLDRDRQAYIEEIDGETAFQNYGNNPLAVWPRRSGEADRVEPVTLPGFKTGFSIRRGTSIFTIGSCFARNIENKLHELGFDIPARSIIDFGSAGPAVLNNYTAASIFNEINWAINPETSFDPALYFYEMGEKVTDLHLGGRWSRPVSKKVAVERRQQIQTVYQRLADADVLILTLGLAEAWYDRSLGLYLNSAPLPSLLAAHPGRFVVRVMRQEEVCRYLRKSFDLIAQYCKPTLRCLLTVSPVPLSVTFRADMDVILANTYSKSVLRSAAEECCADYDFVHYYPSYESVILSNRDRAWIEDQVHVTEEIVDTNISRMIAAYVAEDDDMDMPVNVSLQRARTSIEQKDPSGALTILQKVLSVDSGNPLALRLKAQAVLATSGVAEAIAVYDDAGIRADTCTELGEETISAFGRLLLRARRFDEAATVARAIMSRRPESMSGPILLGDVEMEAGNMADARAAYLKALEISRRVGLPYFKLAKLNEAVGDFERALLYLEIALTINPQNVVFARAKTALDARLQPSSV